MAAYVIYQAEVFDPAQYEKYKAKTPESIAAFGGRFIVRGGEIDVLEGEAPPGRTVVLEFPSMPAARDWYASDQYAEARVLRDGAVRARVYIVDGIE
ncbi:MAG: DUF1330 domain-containing protein [Myxococcota bacterium]|jgi:uncharacterized protein (DUF1330 family)